MRTSKSSSRTFLASCALISTCVEQTLAIPVARTQVSGPPGLQSLATSEATSSSFPTPDYNERMLTTRQTSTSSSKPEVFVYYGQVPATAGTTLSDICADPDIDKVALAFVTSFTDASGFPILKLGNNCPTVNPAQTAAGATGLQDCVASGLADQVATCQRAGKPVLLSLGGGTATDMVIPSQDAAQRYAQSIWDLFLGNVDQTDVRPFGEVILDGVDIDIEHGSGAYLVDFAVALRKLMDTSSERRYYLTAAPQCSDLTTPTSGTPATTIPWLDLAPYLDSVLVQFYNNPTCDFTTTSLFMSSLTAWSEALGKIEPINTDIASGPSQASIARPNYKVVSVDGLSSRADSSTVLKRQGAGSGPNMLIGASATSAVGSGYLPASDLAQIFQQVGVQPPSNLGGVMYWDGVWCLTESASQAGGKTFQQAAKAIFGGSA